MFTVREIAASLGAEAEGDLDLTISRAAEPQDAGPDDLAMAMAPKYAENLSDGSARVALVWEGADWQSMGLKAAIFAPRPRLAMGGVTRLLDPGQGFDDFGIGVHPSAVVHPEAELADVEGGEEDELYEEEGEELADSGIDEGEGEMATPTESEKMAAADGSGFGEGSEAAGSGEVDSMASGEDAGFAP
ncbi:MAG: LpxD N-terminal domain-containing protein, partial [Phaeobacter italicus]